MEGFFSKKEVESIIRPGGRKTGCFQCGLHANCLTLKMEPYGGFKKKILNIGEAPGEWEDKKGKPWQGKTGELLRKQYAKMGINLFEDCLNINAVNCRPVDEKGNNRTPTSIEIDSCRKNVLECIHQNKPQVIVLLGATAVESLIGYRWKREFGSISKWRGWAIPDQDFEAWVVPTFYPSFVERAGADDVTGVIWRQDLSLVKECLKLPFPKYKEPDIEIIDDLSVLNNIQGPIAIDYETNRLKPYSPGSRIVTVAIADSEDHCFAFKLPASREGRKPLLRLLTDEKIPKMAHNIKFEDNWSSVRFGIEVKGWDWDTMLASHILDNRPGITSLKFQAYVNFGVVDYESDVADTLGEDLEEAIKSPAILRKVLTYNGLDSIFTYRLAMLQKKIMNV